MCLFLFTGERTWYLQQLGGRDDSHRRSLPCPCSVINSVQEQTNPDGLVRPPAQLQWAGALVPSIHSFKLSNITLIPPPHTHTHPTQTLHKSGTLSAGGATLAGALVGMTETVFHTPFETCKIRMQAKEFVHCQNSWECAQEMLRGEGVLSFYRGFEVRFYLLCEG